MKPCNRRTERPRQIRPARQLFTPLSLLVLGVLSACSTSPVQPPQSVTPLSMAFRNADQSQAPVSDGTWWQGFGDAELTTLVVRALRANQDVALAIERVRQARAGTDAQASRLLPTVGLQAAAQHTDSGLPAAVKQGQPDTRAYQVGVNLAWEVDLSGGVRAARDGAAANATAADAGVAGARLWVASEVARQYFTLRGAEERLRIVTQLAAAQRETARRIESRQREGLSSAFDQDRASSEAETLEAALPPLRTLIGTTQTKLAVLTGSNPSQVAVADRPEFSWPASSAIAAGQPSDLLRRRPDLMAAEARFGAETFRVAESRAQWWPKLFVSALVGREDLNLNGLDFSPARFSNVALALATPIFNAGRINADIQAQTSKAQEALLVWQKSVLVAVQEVEDSLLAREQERHRGERLQAAVMNRQRSLQRADSLYREGQVDLLTLLDVQRSVLADKLSLSDSRMQQAMNDVQLYKALGGGFGVKNESQTGATTTLSSLNERSLQ